MIELKMIKNGLIIWEKKDKNQWRWSCRKRGKGIKVINELVHHISLLFQLTWFNVFI